MRIYNYHPEMKFYTSTCEAEESPLEPGVYLIPAHATEEQPPETQDDEIAVYDNGWKIIQNYHGVKVWDKITKKSRELLYAQEPTDNETTIEPTHERAEWNDGNWHISDAVEKEERKEEIEIELRKLDKQTIRSLRAILARKENEELKAEQKDKDILVSIEKQARKLRKELQALLDVPQQEGFPNNIVWPEVPDGQS